MCVLYYISRLLICSKLLPYNLALVTKKNKGSWAMVVLDPVLY